MELVAGGSCCACHSAVNMGFSQVASYQALVYQWSVINECWVSLFGLVKYQGKFCIHQDVTVTGTLT